MTPDPARALRSVRAAVSRVLEVDPGVLRPDTPLADLGCDPVALVAIVDLLTGDVADGDGLDGLVAAVRTVGDLIPVCWAGSA